jgi:glycosyltransferase involved in cell wall biosynthesis
VKPFELIFNSPLLRGDAKAPGVQSFEKDYLNLRYGIPPKNYLFVYLGTLSKGRGIEMYLDVFSRCALPVHLIFIGSGDLEEVIADYALHYDNIHLHQPVDHASVVPLVALADFGLCVIENASLSDYYALPNKLFEYGFAGLPVITSDFPEMRLLVERYNLGVCCDPSPAGLSRAIQEVVESSQRFVDVDMFELSWTAQANKLRQLYVRLL